MPVRVVFECGGCDAKADGTGDLRMEFRSLSGRTYGLGGPVPANRVEDLAPEGWRAFDPWTYCTYCPKCWTEIRDANDAAAPTAPGRRQGGDE